MLKRTCNFVKSVKRRRVLYLTLVRSQFKHCSPLWRPTSTTLIDKFEKFQKKCIKWILCEEEFSYHAHHTYLIKCKQVNILPLSYRFDLNDLVLFHKIVYKLNSVTLPEYLKLFDGQTQLRTTHLDSLSYVSSLNYSASGLNKLNKSFF